LAGWRGTLDRLLCASNDFVQILGHLSEKFRSSGIRGLDAGVGIVSWGNFEHFNHLLGVALVIDDPRGTFLATSTLHSYIAAWRGGKNPLASVRNFFPVVQTGVNRNGQWGDTYFGW